MSAALPLSAFRHLFSSVAEEMGEALRLASVSANIKERRDYSCALVDARGRLTAHAAHIPVHLGSAHTTVPALLKTLNPKAGDVVVLNDPHRGGTHLNDVTVVAPLFVGRRRVGFLLNRAHHNDVGGVEPGSLTGATTLEEEGVCLEPMLLTRAGEEVPEVWDIFETKMREPEARRGDLLAQCAALHRGALRFQELVERFGIAPITKAMSDLHRHGAQTTRSMLRSWPTGVVTVQDSLDGLGTPIIKLRLENREGVLSLDFSGTSGQVPGSWNTHRAVVLSAAFYVLQLLAPEELPETGGVLRPVRLNIPRKSLLGSAPPAGVAVGNTETSQRIADVLLSAFGGLLDRQVPAASQGSMNNLCFGGNRADGSEFVYYETLGGGSGGGPSHCGADAIQVHMTNTRNTPIEVFESELPVRVHQLGLRSGSGGAGRHPGGEGLVKEIEFLVPVRIGVIATRRQSQPKGMAGGGAAKSGIDQVLLHTQAGNPRPWRALEAGESVTLQAGDRVRLKTPGGGGWGKPRTP